MRVKASKGARKSIVRQLEESRRQYLKAEHRKQEVSKQKEKLKRT